MRRRERTPVRKGRKGSAKDAKGRQRKAKEGKGSAGSAKALRTASVAPQLRQHREGANAPGLPASSCLFFASFADPLRPLRTEVRSRFQAARTTSGARRAAAMP